MIYILNSESVLSVSIIYQYQLIKLTFNFLHILLSTLSIHSESIKFKLLIIFNKYLFIKYKKNLNFT